MLKNLVYIEIMIATGTAIFYLLSNRATRREVGILPGLILGAMAAIVFLSPNLVVTFIAIGLLPLIFGRTKLQVGIIVAAGMFAVPLLPMEIRPGGVWLIMWTTTTSVAVGGMIAFQIAKGRQLKAPPWADSSMIFVILVLIYISTRGGALTGYLRDIVTYTIDYFFPVYVITRCVGKLVEWRTIMAALACLGCILAVLGLYEAGAGWPLFSPLYAHYGFPVETLVKFRGGILRAYGTVEEPTALGATLVICFCAALASRRAFKSNLAYVAIVALIALGTLAPQSRGGMIGIAVAFVVSSFYRRGIGSVAQLGLAGLLISGIYVGTTVFGSFGAQIATSLEDGQGSADYRTELLRRGMEEFWKSPIIGENYNTVVARMQDMVQGEGMVDFVNSYLYFALFAGAIGLVIFCISFLVPMIRLAAVRRSLPPGSIEREIAGFCLAVLVSAAVMIAFTSYLKRPSIMWLAAASMGLIVAAPRRFRTNAPAAQPRIKVPSDPIAA